MKKTIKKILQNNQINNLDLLISQAIKKPKEFIYTHPEYKLTIFECIKLRYYIYLRKKNYPLAYITKNKEFYGLNFYVNKNVLVPRPETELMVEEVIKIINKEQLTKNKTILIDIGTGSGCIPVSIVKTITNQHPLSPPQGGTKYTPLEGGRRVVLDVTAIDISKKALKIAKKNANKHKVDIQFLYGNLLSPFLKQLSNRTIEQSNIIITANLPYLTKGQFENEPSIQKEPKKALVAKKNGLELYNILLQQIKKLTAYNLQLTAFLEIDPSQTKKIGQYIGQYLPEAKFKVRKDLAKLDRLIVINLD